MIFVHGDLLEANADAICQQVNCRNVMGAGLAREICARWPDVKELYHEYCDECGDPYALLGSVHVVRKHGNMPFDVVNVFGQLNYGRQSVCYTSYNALEAAFLEINSLYRRKTVAFPYKFGCGLAGGDWTLVQELIQDCLTDCEVMIYIKY